MDKIKNEFYVNAVKYDYLVGEDKVLADKILYLIKDDIELMSIYEGCFVNFITADSRYRLNMQSNYTDEITSKLVLALSKARQ